MRRLISVLGLLLVMGAVIPVASQAAATSSTTPKSVAATCGAWSGATLSAQDKRDVRRARDAVDEVFEGRVNLPRRAPAKGSLQLNVHVLATWKGTVQPQTTVTVSFRPGDCRSWTLAHPQHEEYLFFIDRTATGDLAAYGGAPRVVAHTAALVQVLGPTTGAIQPPPPTPVTFTATGAAEPRPFMKAAAPGIALVLVGLLGLLVVARIGRRSI